MSAEAIKALLDAAKELLAVRDLKLRLDADYAAGAFSADMRRLDVADYERRKPLAWEALNAAVEQIDALGTVW